MDQRARILETAFQMFSGIGYTSVTMEQIARRCGIGKATLYKHFASKEELLLGCVDYYTDRVRAEMEWVIADETKSPQQKVVDFIVPVVRFVSHVNSSVLDDIQRLVPEAYERIDTNRRSIILSNIGRIMREGKESGIFREDVNEVLVAHVLIGTVSHLSNPQLMEEIGLPPGQLIQMVFSIVWNGCLSEKGRRMP